MHGKLNQIFVLLSIIFFFACTEKDSRDIQIDLDHSIKYCEEKLQSSFQHFKGQQKLPRVIFQNQKHWSGSSINSWTSGFYAGLLWLMYDYTGDEYWKQNAAYYTHLLEPVKRLPWKTHDFSFMMYYSYGLGFQFTKSENYRRILLETADSLATLYNPKTGTIESWPWMKRKRNWPHTTIIDNMMNLELLFWAADNGGNSHYRDIAIKHAKKTMQDFIRPDFSTIHIVIYDSASSKIIKKATVQGYGDNTTWARGHSWATYGFIKAYKYCRKDEFLKTAKNLAHYYLNTVPEDMIPYWDFDAPLIPNEPKDASAAAIMASALFELSNFCQKDKEKQKYFTAGMNILRTLNSEKYKSRNNDAFLTGSVGSKPNGNEVDVSLIYTDYFYLEALLKAKRIKSGPAARE